MKKTGLMLAGALAMTMVGAAAANAAAISGLYDTGLDASGNVITTNGTADAHYTVNGGQTAYVYNNPAYITTSDASYIAVNGGGGYTVNPNVYSLTFNLGSLDASTAQLSGSFAADNHGDAYLNGNLLAHTDTFTSLTSFSANSSDFVQGENVLSFSVLDDGPPSAFVVSGLSGMASTVSAAPEPSVWALMFAGVAMVGGMLRLNRRRGMQFAA